MKQARPYLSKHLGREDLEFIKDHLARELASLTGTEPKKMSAIDDCFRVQQREYNRLCKAGLISIKDGPIAAVDDVKVVVERNVELTEETAISRVSQKVVRTYTLEVYVTVDPVAAVGSRSLASSTAAAVTYIEVCKYLSEKLLGRGFDLPKELVVEIMLTVMSSPQGEHKSFSFTATGDMLEPKSDVEARHPAREVTITGERLYNFPKIGDSIALGMRGVIRHDESLGAHVEKSRRAQKVPCVCCGDKFDAWDLPDHEGRCLTDYFVGKGEDLSRFVREHTVHTEGEPGEEIETAHAKANPFRCPTCSERFEDVNDFTRHVGRCMWEAAVEAGERAGVEFDDAPLKGKARKKIPSKFSKEVMEEMKEEIKRGGVVIPALEEFIMVGGEHKISKEAQKMFVVDDVQPVDPITSKIMDRIEFEEGEEPDQPSGRGGYEPEEEPIPPLEPQKKEMPKKLLFKLK